MESDEFRIRTLYVYRGNIHNLFEFRQLVLRKCHLLALSQQLLFSLLMKSIEINVNFVITVLKNVNIQKSPHQNVILVYHLTYRTKDGFSEQNLLEKSSIIICEYFRCTLYCQIRIFIYICILFAIFLFRWNENWHIVIVIFDSQYYVGVYFESVEIKIFIISCYVYTMLCLPWVVI